MPRKVNSGPIIVSRRTRVKGIFVLLVRAIFAILRSFHQGARSHQSLILPRKTPQSRQSPSARITSAGAWIIAPVLLGSGAATRGQEYLASPNRQEGTMRPDMRPEFEPASPIDTQWSLPAEGSYTADSTQTVIEPTGTGSSDGTVWIDPIPEEVAPTNSKRAGV